MGERIKKKRLSAESSEVTCLAKVTQVLERGQRLTIEYAGALAVHTSHHVRALGTARDYDTSMLSGEKGISKVFDILT
ncbi:hypothetical protein ABW19_dt0204274 [Dactylella cylindrospora]|nr:hypothetical protein ABW19_dt0204274 [Dactylella cylindrospora]